MANPGCPIVYGDANLVTDFRDRKFSLRVRRKWCCKPAPWGKWHGSTVFRNEQGGCLSDALEPGPQAIMEKMLSTLPLVISGVDVVQGIGAIENSNCVCLEQIVVDNEIALQCRKDPGGESMSRTGPTISLK